MPIEGMVDALRHAHQLARFDGVIVDVHPTATRAVVEIGGRAIGWLDDGDAPLRHRKASEAVELAVADRLFAATAAVDFVFYTIGDTIDELRDHVAATWRTTRIGDEVVRRTREVAGATPEAKPRVREEVRLTTLRPIQQS